MQYISIITLINSVIQDTQQIMTGQFDLSGTCPNDTEPLPNLTADFSVITFQHDCILLGGRNMIKTKVIQQSGKVARGHATLLPVLSVGMRNGFLWNRHNRVPQTGK